ncbi:tetratricopeptide repeat protein [Candidatus Poribacteria bacterium]|nr:tetratricopeptide repeat protein [Candidatus Poribacteria bacterium]
MSLRLTGAALCAVSALVTGCGVAPEMTDAYNGYAIDAARHGLWLEAALRWEQARSISPNDPRIANNLGVAYESQARFDDALAEYRRAVALDPGNADYQRNLRRGEAHRTRAAELPPPPDSDASDDPGDDTDEAEPLP